MMSKATTGRVASNSTKKPQLKENESKTKLGFPIVAPLGNKKHFTSFSAIYSKGQIPCRLQHGSIKHKLIWTQDLTSLDYNPLFITFCDGLRESQHPYRFIVEIGLIDLIESPGAYEKILALIPNAVPALRNGLSQKEKKLFLTSVKVLRGLIYLLKEAMYPYLSSLLPPIASRILVQDLEIREAVNRVNVGSGGIDRCTIKLWAKCIGNH
ncbi:hypothetical protein HDV06_006187 [Boothiomyces sp. JEL0866]|nr:hypothetical protein HDV06_006187 [Boothiomyces sp. JEL0866]